MREFTASAKTTQTGGLPDVTFTLDGVAMICRAPRTRS